MKIRAFLALLITFISFNLFAFDEEKFAQALGLELVSEGHPYNFLGVNTMYANDSLSRQMLVVKDVKAHLPEMRIIKARGYLILEIPRNENSYASMALVGITEEEITKNIKTTSVWRKIWNELDPLPKAYSEECAVRGTASAAGLEGLQNFYGSSFAKGALKCMSNFFQGVWDATGGQVAGAVEGIKNLIADPAAFWDKRVEEMKNIGKFIAHFDTKMKEMYGSIANLPAETKTQMLCSFVGGLGGNAALAILAGGAGLGKLLFQMEGYVSRIMSLEKVFSLLEKSGKLKTIPTRFYETLSTGRLPQSVMDTLNTFAFKKFPDLVEGAIACML